MDTKFRTLSALSCAIALIACSEETSPIAASSQTAETARDELVLSWDGYGPVHFGMQLAQAEAVAGTRANAERELDPGCDYTEFTSLPNVRFMVENGVITRGEAEAGVPNSRDIMIGDSLVSVTQAHTDAEVQPHKYDTSGHYILFRAPAGDRAIVVETADDIVMLIRAGLEPAVEYVESCS